MQTTDAINVLRYRVDKDKVVILGCKKGRKNLVIPSEIDNKPVKEIDSYAFYKNPSLTRVTIPPTVKVIGKGAFSNMGPVLVNVFYPDDVTLYSNVFGDNVLKHPYTDYSKLISARGD